MNPGDPITLLPGNERAIYLRDVREDHARVSVNGRERTVLRSRCKPERVAKPVWVSRPDMALEGPAAAIAMGLMEVTHVDNDAGTVTVDYVQQPGAAPALVHAELAADYAAYREALGATFQRAATAVLRAVPKAPKPMRSASYMRYVREHPCCRCETTQSIEAHHFGEHGMSVKPDDFRTVPLCTACHREFHDMGVLRPLSRDGTEELFLDAQAELLRVWMKGRDITASRIYVDACLAALREENRR